MNIWAYSFSAVIICAAVAVATSAIGGQVAKPLPLGGASDASSPLDHQFGTGGIVRTPLGPGNDVPQAIAVQPDGRIVVAGYAFNGVNNDFALVRYEPNGELDQSFDGDTNGNGIVFASVGDSEDEAFGVAIQPDGKIVVVGQTYNGIKTEVAVVRFDANGRLDNTFDSDGRQTIEAGTGNALARSVAVQPDGRIVVAGIALNSGSFEIALIRLMPDGTRDETFTGDSVGQGGLILTNVGPGHDQAYAVAVRPGGRIIVAGYYNGPTSTDTLLLGYLPDGRPDPGFGSGGTARHSFSSADTDEALAMAVRADGKLVIAGCIRTPGVANDFLIARLNEDGTRDTSFGNNGFTTAAFSPNVDIGFGVAVQSNGKIVATGFGYNGRDNDFATTRVHANGDPDATFGENGRTLTMVGTNADAGNAIAIQQDGKVVVAGRTVGTTADFGVVRFRAEAGSISGRVVTPAGQAIRNARVNLIAPTGLTRTDTTSSFGTFRFDDVPTGQSMTLTVGSKRYRFAPRTFDFAETLADVDLIGLE